MLTRSQLAHMKHFSEPLTALASSDCADIDLASESASPFVDALAARLHLSSDADLLGAVDAARDTFRRRARRLRVGLSVAEVVRRVARTKVDDGPLRFANAVLRGRAERDVEHLGLVVQCVSCLLLRTCLISYPLQKLYGSTAPRARGAIDGLVLAHRRWRGSIH